MKESTRGIEPYRVKKFSSEADGFNGLFFVPGDNLRNLYGEGAFMKVVVSSGFGWDHVSVMHPDREVTAAEMRRIRRMFWSREETVVEYHDPGSYMGEDNTPKERHLWCPQGCDVIRPPERITSPFLISIEEDGVEGYQEVESTNIAAVMYDDAEETLFVVFTSGGHYAYSNVPQEVYDRLMDAESVGKFFHAHIRNDYPVRKIEENDD